MNSPTADEPEPSRRPLPHYLEAMVRRLPPPGTEQYVVPGSTPVVSFGHARTATVATVGINPSRIEFEVKGVFLEGARRRLATLLSLGLPDLQALAEGGPEQLAQVVDDCDHYFTGKRPTSPGNPYWRWFGPLQRLLEEGGLPTYRDGGACHLDLVQWATDPVWSKIKDRAARKALLDDGVPHLRHQLAQGDLRLVLLNGRQVLNQIEATGIAQLQKVGVLTFHENCSDAELYVGHSGGVCFLGWSTNIPSSAGSTGARFREALAHWIKQHHAECEVGTVDGGV